MCIRDRYSTGDVTKRIKTRFESLEKENDKLHMTILMNQGVYIDTIVESVMETMIVGAILAVLILILFLKDSKPTLVIACSIPLSVVFAKMCIRDRRKQRNDFCALCIRSYDKEQNRGSQPHRWRSYAGSWSYRPLRSTGRTQMCIRDRTEQDHRTCDDRGGS